MARKEIGNPLDRENRNNHNDNYKELFKEIGVVDKRIDGMIDEISDQAFDKVIDNSKLNWKEPVNNFNSLPSSAQKGDTRMDRSTGKVYRYDGSEWKEIQQIDVGPVNELDSRLTSQLNDKVNSDLLKDLRNGYYDGPVVAFVFDDGRKEMWEKFKDLFASEGVPCTIPATTGSIDTNPNYMTTAQLKVLQELGWTICSHTVTHPNIRDLTPEEIEVEYRDSHLWLKERGFSDDIIVYPHGATTPVARKIASKYYKMGVNIVRNNLSNDVPKITNLNLNRLSGFSNPPGNEPTYNDVKQRFDLGVVRNELMIYVDHPQYPSWTPERINDLRNFIRYIKSKGVPIVNLEDAYQMKCNVIEIGDEEVGYFYKIHRNGQSTSNDSVYYLAEGDEFKPNDSVYNFPESRITRVRFSNTLTGLPIQSQAYAEIDRTGDFPNLWFMKVIYTSATNGTITYYRGWDESKLDWGRWASSGELIGNTHLTNLPAANVSNRGRMLLVRGKNGQEDELLICANNGSGFEWKKINMETYQ